MRNILKKIIEILDGTPAVYGQRQRGQSALELALVTPLLIILLTGMIEIGWLARNYIDLLEVTRVGARTATVQEGETDPKRWDNRASHVPEYNSNEWIRYRNCSGGTEAYIGFYSFIACVMQRAFQPHVMAVGDAVDEVGDPFPDDIIISAFAVQALIPDEVPSALRSRIEWPTPLTGGNMLDAQAVVVGRYPTNANECTELGERDPFDYIQDFTRTTATDLDGRLVYVEEDGYDSVDEIYRGFSWYGRHTIPETGCIGSLWSVADVERLVNLTGFDRQMTTGQRIMVPSQGIVLVEMHWRHNTLSQYVGLGPVFSPVFAMLGERVNLNVWAAFPLPKVEPKIRFR